MIKNNANNGGNKIEEENESYDYDSYLSSNSDEVDTLIHKANILGGLEEDDGEENDDIDVEKLDFEDRALLARLNALK